MSTGYKIVVGAKLTGKGQNVNNHFVKSQKKNIESQKVDQKFEKDQNIESIY